MLGAVVAQFFSDRQERPVDFQVLDICGTKTVLTFKGFIRGGQLDKVNQFWLFLSVVLRAGLVIKPRKQ